MVDHGKTIVTMISCSPPRIAQVEIDTLEVSSFDLGSPSFSSSLQGTNKTGIRDSAKNGKRGTWQLPWPALPCTAFFLAFLPD